MRSWLEFLLTRYVFIMDQGDEWYSGLSKIHLTFDIQIVKDVQQQGLWPQERIKVRVHGQGKDHVIFKLWLNSQGYDWRIMIREVVEFVDDVGAGLGMWTSRLQITAGVYGDV